MKFVHVAPFMSIFLVFGKFAIDRKNVENVVNRGETTINNRDRGRQVVATLSGWDGNRRGEIMKERMD